MVFAQQLSVAMGADVQNIQIRAKSLSDVFLATTNI